MKKEINWRYRNLTKPPDLTTNLQGGGGGCLIQPHVLIISQIQKSENPTEE